MTRRELDALGWDAVDVLLISGDAYVDHPSFGSAVIARILIDAGYRVGLACQPDWRSPEPLTEFGRPRLAAAVTSGNLDSMLNIYTAGRRKRRRDAYSPDGVPGLRPPRSLSVYAQLAKKAFPGLPVIIGGIEASMRRVAHYDYWSDKIRPSELVASKADILVFGMAEKSVVEVLNRLNDGQSLSGVRGTARLLGGRESAAFADWENTMSLPSCEDVSGNPGDLMKSTIAVEEEANPFCGRRLAQWHGSRLLLVEPPRRPLAAGELDEIYELPFSRRPHPVYNAPIPAFEMIKESVTSVRGCPGGCAFCGISLHQGRMLSSRSRDSVLREIRVIAAMPYFKGIISDLGGPTANCYGSRQDEGGACRACRRSSCLFPRICPGYRVEQQPMLKLLEAAAAVKGVKRVHISSGIRMDVARRQPELIARMVAEHVSGQLKVAPEHIDAETLRLMRKNPPDDFNWFRRRFAEISEKAGKKQFVVPYFISNHPGCDAAAAAELNRFLESGNWTPRQTQDFIPLPMTMSAAMYHCGESADGEPVAVSRGLRERRSQRDALKPGKRRGWKPARSF